MNSKSLLTFNLLLLAGLNACGDSAKKGAPKAVPSPEVKVVGQPGAVNVQGRYKLVSISCNDRLLDLDSEFQKSFSTEIDNDSLAIHANVTDAASGLKCVVDMQSHIVELNYEASFLKSKQVKSVANCVDAQGTKMPEQNLADANDANKIEEVKFRKVNDRQLEIKDTLDKTHALTGCEQGQTLSTLLERE